MQNLRISLYVQKNMVPTKKNLPQSRPLARFLCWLNDQLANGLNLSRHSKIILMIYFKLFTYQFLS